MQARGRFLVPRPVSASIPCVYSESWIRGLSEAGMSHAVRLHTSTPYVCNSQLSILRDCGRMLSCAHPDHDFFANDTFKQKAVYHRQLLYAQRRKMCLPFHATPKKTAEEIAGDNPTSDSMRSESLIRNELSALDAYFNKLQGKSKQEMDSCSSDLKLTKLDSAVDVAEDSKLPRITAESASPDDSLRTDLRSIETYLQNLSKGGSEQAPSPTDVRKAERELEMLMKEIAPGLQLIPVQEITDDQYRPLVDEPSNASRSESSVVYVLAAINIAVYLFGLASPVDTAGMGTSTLPVLYGAKVNELLLNGEWWRLITPMFLHSGFFHITLSSWALLFFGPQVENVYGPLAFCMIYFLGGLCGNICSFFFTPAATVGGTGPLFALFSAWVVYLLQNKGVLGEQSADYGIKATTLIGVLVICLSCLLPTDEWIHLGAILPGILFGSFAAPVVQSGLDAIKSSAKNTRNQGEPYAVFDSPSVLSLSVVFALSTGLCFTIYNILAALVENSQFLENTPH